MEIVGPHFRNNSYDFNSVIREFKKLEYSHAVLRKTSSKRGWWYEIWSVGATFNPKMTNFKFFVVRSPRFFISVGTFIIWFFFPASAKRARPVMILSFVFNAWTDENFNMQVLILAFKLCRYHLSSRLPKTCWDDSQLSVRWCASSHGDDRCWL